MGSPFQTREGLNLLKRGENEKGESVDHYSGDAREDTEKA
jgi:hypothetical protein